MAYNVSGVEPLSLKVIHAFFFSFLSDKSHFPLIYSSHKEGNILHD